MMLMRGGILNYSAAVAIIKKIAAAGNGRRGREEAHSMKKVIILIGNYGSGKTEIALNMALKASEEGKKTQVIDLDRINDYFRMSDNVKLLEEGRINLVSPTFAGQGVTQTNMPAAVGSAFAQDWDLVIFDVGGDPAGALSLARYHQDFAQLAPGQLEVYDIVNVFRPMSETPEKILKLKADMEADPCGRVAEVRQELEWLLSVEDEACRLTDWFSAGKLPHDLRQRRRPAPRV